MLKCIDNSLYTGITNNIKERILTHYYKKPGCAKYTRSHQVTGIAAVWTANEKSDALRLEKFIKSLPRNKKIDLSENQESLSELVGDKFDSSYFHPYKILFEEIINEQSKQNS